MVMEVTPRTHQEEANACMMMIKGKRTKRQRPLSPLSLAMPSSSSNSEIISTEEEEDMAHCLILLAQGGSAEKPRNGCGLYSYECKTCNRCFPSFQALGGHRASHKKPKPAAPEAAPKKALKLFDEQNDLYHFIRNNTTSAAATATTTTLSLQVASRVDSTKYNKVHECSVCGVEFSSGQALGGHMRRHRTASATTTTAATPTSSTSLETTSNIINISEFQEAKRSPRTNLQLDLNLPAAPEEERREAKFGFPGSKEQVLVFSASPMVDCHY